MPYSEFTIEKVQTLLNIELDDGNLFSSIEPYPLRADFVDSLKRGAELALAINTEKAKSEFIIAPLLLEVKHILHDSISIFSGIEFSVDAERGLNGVCDFIISKDRRQHLLSAPTIMVVEARNDNLRNSAGQCVAEMVAAQQFNRESHWPFESIHGLITTGSAWKFLRLTQNTVTLDLEEHFINEPQKLVGILVHILTEG